MINVRNKLIYSVYELHVRCIKYVLNPAAGDFFKVF